MEKICIKKELYILNYEFLKFMSFSIFILFLNEFLSIFIYSNHEKGNLLTCRMTWRVGPSGMLTWRTGPLRG